MFIFKSKDLMVISFGLMERQKQINENCFFIIFFVNAKFDIETRALGIGLEPARRGFAFGEGILLCLIWPAIVVRF